MINHREPIDEHNRIMDERDKEAVTQFENEGGGNNVVSIDEFKIEKTPEDYAKEFVDRYQKEGAMPAAKWIYESVPEVLHDKLREPIQREFLKRGFTFPEVE